MYIFGSFNQRHVVSMWNKVISDIIIPWLFDSPLKYTNLDRCWLDSWTAGRVWRQAWLSCRHEQGTPRYPLAFKKPRKSLDEVPHTRSLRQPEASCHRFWIHLVSGTKSEGLSTWRVITRLYSRGVSSYLWPSNLDTLKTTVAWQGLILIKPPQPHRYFAVPSNEPGFTVC